MAGTRRTIRTRDGAEGDAATHRGADPDLPSYISHLTRQRLLRADEEAALARLARQGDLNARKRLVEANMRLVVSIAKSYHSPVMPFEDLVQEGAIGLMVACERFDPSRGLRFSTYATYWIRQAIGRAIDNKGRAIRVPAHVSETARKIDRARAAAQRTDGREPSLEELAATVGLSPERIRRVMRASMEPLSLDALVGDDESTPLSAMLSDQNAIDPQAVVLESEMLSVLQGALATLGEREQAVIRHRLGLEDGTPHVLQEVGDELHLSRERIRQIESHALKHLRSPANRRRLREYLA